MSLLHTENDLELEQKRKSVQDVLKGKKYSVLKENQSVSKWKEGRKKAILSDFSQGAALSNNIIEKNFLTFMRTMKEAENKKFLNEALSKRVFGEVLPNINSIAKDLFQFPIQDISSERIFEDLNYSFFSNKEKYKEYRHMDKLSSDKRNKIKIAILQKKLKLKKKDETNKQKALNDIKKRNPINGQKLLKMNRYTQLAKTRMNLMNFECDFINEILKEDEREKLENQESLKKTQVFNQKTIKSILYNTSKDKSSRNPFFIPKRMNLDFVDIKDFTDHSKKAWKTENFRSDFIQKNLLFSSIPIRETLYKKDYQYRNQNFKTENLKDLVKKCDLLASVNKKIVYKIEKSGN